MVLCDIMISKKRGQANVPIYAAPCCSSGHGPVPLSSKMKEYYTMSQKNIAMNPPSTVQARHASPMDSREAYL